MLQDETPDDYVVATGVTHSVREFVETAFTYLGLDYTDFVKIDPKFYRPEEQIQLCGNSDKFIQKLGWERTKTFKDIIHNMVDQEMLLHKYSDQV